MNDLECTNPRLQVCTGSISGWLCMRRRAVDFHTHHIVSGTTVTTATATTTTATTATTTTTIQSGEAPF